ncbi:hypothetical protein [Pseudoalteromonas sp. NEC-BIFX-2020_002]|uniref:hypothetical protein n=1 Tax=Pseudoalteromonas sp. NEC-BIFX-2020_002 TaxID=2732353 RepID=UPI002016AFB2|nr:hypothetical protein [Pseudoalteromonas sp. NEC-BIFX-2020_002]
MKIFYILPLLCYFYSTSALSQRQNITDYLTIEYQNSIKAYDAKLEKCQQTEVTITPNDVKHISDDWAVLSSALSYHYAKTQDLCARDELERYSLLSAKLQALKDTDKPMLDKYNQLLMAIPLAYERTKADYFILPQGMRKQFSDLEKLNKPFNLMKTMDNFD